MNALAFMILGERLMIRGIREKFTWMFLVTSLIPIFLLGGFSFYNISTTLQNNSKALIQTNLEQLDSNLHAQLDGYSDLLYQIYTDDNMISWIENLENNTDTALTTNQMRRFINGLLNSKSYIRAITVITPGGKVITYDQMNSRTDESAWLSNFSMTKEEIYDEVMSDSWNHIFGTEYAATFANKDYYTFHMAHRMIDYHDISEECGIVILSIDEEFLENICNNTSGLSDAIYFIGDDSNRLCYIDDEEIDLTNTKKYTYFDESLSWTIEYYHDESEQLKSLTRQLLMIVSIAAGVLVIAFAYTRHISAELESSTKLILKGMTDVEEGNIAVRINKPDKMLKELGQIADGFNSMTSELEAAINSERRAIENQKEAQIKALEAQINPHFLYNTLDSINWMAIDKDEYDISNAINALAAILRYAISNSNKEVTFRDEIEWLEKYILLQQYRLKNKFECKIDLPQDLQNAKTYKLLMQPFIENAIVHAFEGKLDEARLTIRIYKEASNVCIEIEDNGNGMPSSLVDYINSGCIESAEDRVHIGINNVITRLSMYYGDNASVRVRSSLGEGTLVKMTIPFIDKQG